MTIKEKYRNNLKKYAIQTEGHTAKSYIGDAGKPDSIVPDTSANPLHFESSLYIMS